jgi:hypothetical protein
LEDVGFNVDAALCGTEGVKNGRIECGAVGKDAEPSRAIDGCIDKGREKKQEWACIVGRNLIPVPHFIAGHRPEQAGEKEGHEQYKRRHADHEPAGGNCDRETEKDAEIH